MARACEACMWSPSLRRGYRGDPWHAEALLLPVRDGGAGVMHEWHACRMLDPELEKYWMPVDLYVGGAEHAVLHLLYARFWHKVLHDIGVVSEPEPFQRLVSQGMILGETEYSVYRDSAGNYTDPEAPGAAPLQPPL